MPIFEIITEAQTQDFIAFQGNISHFPAKMSTRHVYRSLIHLFGEFIIWRIRAYHGAPTTSQHDTI